MSGIALTPAEMKEFVPDKGIKLSPSDMKDFVPASATAAQSVAPAKKILGMNPATVSGMAKTFLEGGGAVAGSIMGAPLGPVGSVGGGVGGYGVGRELSNLLDEKLGLRQPPSNLGDVGHSLLRDASQGLLAEATGLGLGAVAGRVANKIASKVGKSDSPLSREAQARLDLADAHNMPVTPSDIHQTKGLAQLEFYLNRSMGSGSTMENFQKGQEARFQSLLDPVAKTASPDLTQSGQDLQQLLSNPQAQAVDALQRRIGSQAPPSEVGRQIQKAMGANKETIAQSARNLYDQTGKPLAGQKHIPENLIDTAKKHLGEIGHLPVKDNSLVSDLQAYSKVPEPKVDPEITKFLNDPATPEPLKETIRKEMGIEPGYTWKDLQNIRSQIGSAIEKEKAASGVPGQKSSGAFTQTDTGRRLEDLKRAVTDDMENFASRSPDAWKSYQEATRLWHLGAKTYGNPLARKTLAIEPEKVADMWIQPKNVSRVVKAQQTLGENGFAPLRQAFGQKIMGTPDHPASPDQIKKTLDKYSRPVIEKVYGQQTSDWLFDQADKAKLSPIQKKAAGAEPASLFTNLLKPGNVKTLSVQDSRNLSNILQVKKVAGKAGIDNLRSQWFAHILSEPKEGGPLTAKQFSDRASAYGPKTLSSLFPDPGELAQIKNLIGLGKIVKGGERIVSNPSGTSNMMMLVTGGELTGAIMEATSGNFGKAGLLAGTILLPKGVAKLYLSKVGRSLLLKGYRMKPGSAAANRLAEQIKHFVGSKNLMEQTGKASAVGLMNTEGKKNGQ